MSDFPSPATTEWVPIWNAVSVGPVGPAGPQGPIGETGPQGVQGLTGPTGATGPTGPQGIQGVPGPIGLQGPAGVSDIPGPQGPKGDTGAQGPIGLTGPQGATGPMGPSGSVGGTGTVNYLTKWATTTTLANSLMSESGNKITMTAAATTTLAIIGTGAANAILQLDAPVTYSAYTNYSRGGAAKWAVGLGVMGTNNFDWYDNVGGQMRMTLTPAGNLGVNTLNPYAKFTVIGASQLPADVSNHFELCTGTGAYPGDRRLAMGINDAGGYAFMFACQPGSGYLNLLLQPDAANTGIRTRTPLTSLHVGTTRDTIALTLQNLTGDTAGADYYVGLSFMCPSGAGGNVSQIRSYSNLYQAWGSKLSFYTTGPTGAGIYERVYINKYGTLVANVEFVCAGNISGASILGSSWGRFKTWGGTPRTGLAAEIGISGPDAYINAYDPEAGVYGSTYIQAGATNVRVTPSGWIGFAGQIRMRYGDYIFPGAADGGVDYQTSAYLAASASYGLLTNTSFYISGTTWQVGAVYQYASQYHAIGSYVFPGSVSGYASHQNSVYLGTYAPYGLYTNSGLYINGDFYAVGNMYGYYGTYTWPGSNTTGGWNHSYYIASSSTYGLYTNTGMYFAGTVYCGGTYIGSRFQDINYSGSNAVYFNASHHVVLTSANSGILFVWDGFQIYAGSTQSDLGHPSYRWKNVFMQGGVDNASDARLKRDVAPTVYSTQFLAALRPVDYNWIDDRELKGRYTGFISQQVAKIAPGFGGISYDKEGVASGLKYSMFIAPLVAGWQDHETRLQKLEAAMENK